MSHASPSSEALLARLLDLHPKLIDLSLGRMTRLLKTVSCLHSLNLLLGVVAGVVVSAYQLKAVCSA